MKRKPYFYPFALLIVLMITLYACGGGSDTPTQKDGAPPSQAVSESPETPTSLPDSPSFASVRDQSGKEFYRVDFEAEQHVIRYDLGEKYLIGKQKRADKTKYYNQEDNLVAEVKYKEDGFKLRDPEGNLLWKIKFKEDKIKVSDNEENANPFEIKLKDTGKYKINSPDTYLGALKYKDGSIRLEEGQLTYQIPASRNHPAYGVLFIESIPEDQRLMIMAQILNRYTL